MVCKCAPKNVCELFETALFESLLVSQTHKDLILSKYKTFELCRSNDGRIIYFDTADYSSTCTTNIQMNMLEFSLFGMRAPATNIYI